MFSSMASLTADAPSVVMFLLIVTLVKVTSSLNDVVSGKVTYDVLSLMTDSILSSDKSPAWEVTFRRLIRRLVLPGNEETCNLHRLTEVLVCYY